MINQLSPAMSFVVYVAVFLGALLAIDGLRQILSREETQADARNRRMRLLKRGNSTEEVLNLLRDPSMLSPGGRISLIGRLRRLILQSGLPLNLFTFLVLVVAVGVAAFFVADRYLPRDIAIAIATVAGPLLPLIALMIQKEERASKLTAQLPDAMDLMARGLKVGHPLAVTVGSVATDMPDPIGSEFGLIQDQIEYGDDLTTAFHEFGERVGTEDAKYLAVSVGIQHGTGGNLARVLQVLSKVIRDRQTMRKKIKAISAEGRLSGVILSVLPVGIFLSIHLTTPSFYGDVWDDPLFKPFAIAIVGLMVGQAAILYKLVKFRF